MKPKISIITLGVKDLAKSRDFYQKGLGLPVYNEGDKENESIIFFELEGTWLSLYPIEKLAEDIGMPIKNSDLSNVTLAHNVSNETEVDHVMESAKQAGATIVKNPQKVFWGGYSGYFTDLDNHLWEVAHNPFMDLA